VSVYVFFGGTSKSTISKKRERDCRHVGRSSETHWNETSAWGVCYRFVVGLLTKGFACHDLTKGIGQTVGNEEAGTRAI